MAVTLAEAQENREIALTAYRNALTNKSYDVSGRNKENQTVGDLRKAFEQADKEVDILLGVRSSGIQRKNGVW